MRQLLQVIRSQPNKVDPPTEEEAADVSTASDADADISSSTIASRLIIASPAESLE